MEYTITTARELMGDITCEWEGIEESISNWPDLTGFYVVGFPEHCLTRQYTGDATYWGPYSNEEDAMAWVGGVK